MPKSWRPFPCLLLGLLAFLPCSAEMDGWMDGRMKKKQRGWAGKTGTRSRTGRGRDIWRQRTHRSLHLSNRRLSPWADACRCCARAFCTHAGSGARGARRRVATFQTFSCSSLPLSAPGMACARAFVRPLRAYAARVLYKRAHGVARARRQEGDA